MKSNLCDAVEKVLIPKSEIDKRIVELGKEITEEYKDKGELIVVGILRGAAMFMSNLWHYLVMDYLLNQVEL